jgi:hypothetical protein
MRGSDVFEVAVRIVGFLLVIISIVRMISLLPQLMPLPLHVYRMDGAGLPDLLQGAVIAALGLLLMFGGRAIARIVYRPNSN